MVVSKLANHIGTVLLATALLFILRGNYTHESKIKAENYPTRTWGRSVLTTDWLKQQIYRNDSSWHSWRQMGMSLHTLFYTGKPDDIKIAMTPAGAIAFYSGLPAYDLLGLNTRGVLSGGIAYDKRMVAHQKIATYSQLTTAGVNLVIWHGSAICKQKNGYVAMPSSPHHYHPFKQTRTVLLPSGPNCYLIADYMNNHPYIEELLANHTILDYRENQDKFQCPTWLCIK